MGKLPVYLVVVIKTDPFNFIQISPRNCMLFMIIQINWFWINSDQCLSEGLPLVVVYLVLKETGETRL